MDMEKARYHMIEQQIRPWNVLDQRLLDAMATIPREEFVPNDQRLRAFMDIAIPLGDGELMMHPKLEGRLLQALNLKPDDSVLEVGTGSGFVTALLSSLAATVTTVEINPSVSQAAAEKLTSHGITNVTFKVGDGVQGWPLEAPFDAILLTGSLLSINPSLRNQLAVDGRLVAVVGTSPAMEAILLERKSGDNYIETSLFDTELPSLENIQIPPEFTF